jgi:hypothetical protein
LETLIWRFGVEARLRVVAVRVQEVVAVAGRTVQQVLRHRVHVAPLGGGLHFLRLGRAGKETGGHGKCRSREKVMLQLRHARVPPKVSAALPAAVSSLNLQESLCQST